jgi:threonine synthase
MAGAPSYENRRTGRSWPIDKPLWRAPDDNGPVELSAGPGLRPDEIDTAEHSLWRYRKAIRTECRVSLGEGWTPLVPTTWQERPVLFKCEHIQPSGSYKDRGISVLVNEMAARGMREILEDSSGNAGAAMATYAAAAGIDCAIYAPASAPAGKLLQIEAMGAALHRIPGTRQDTTDAAMAAAKTRFYASHAWQPFFLEGIKTLAFELWEQCGFRPPDHVVVPAGQGGNILGLAVGFAELVAAGQIETSPRLHVIQAENCSPLVSLFENAVAKRAAPTIADGIASPKPVRAAEIVEAVRRTGGKCVKVSERDILDALRTLLACGWYVEPTTAAGAAGLSLLQTTGTIRSEETTVLLLTGHGLKAGSTIADALAT